MPLRKDTTYKQIYSTFAHAILEERVDNRLQMVGGVRTYRAEGERPLSEVDLEASVRTRWDQADGERRENPVLRVYVEVLRALLGNCDISPTWRTRTRW